MQNSKKKTAAIGIALILAATPFAIAGCAGQPPQNANNANVQNTVNTQTQVSNESTDSVPTKESLIIKETLSNSTGGEHVIESDGTTDSYSSVKVEKTGDSAQNDEADFYGDNSAVFATNTATLDLSGILVETNGRHANAVFSYGEGTTVNIENSVIETSGDCSGGLMTTGGATMNASNLNISTSGRSSAAIRSDRGGGTVNVDGGIYKTSGVGSPAIYSTADITVKNAQLESSTSEGVVIEGKNSVSLENVDLTADNNQTNSDKSDTFKAVMIYQSMSGDAAVGDASFTMDGGSITNKNGDVFFVNNTVAKIDLSKVEIVNADADGLFLRAAAAGWGSEGKNGGQVDLNASNQKIDGNIVVDEISNLNLVLSDGSSFSGAINADGAAGEVYVELDDTSKWTLSADSYVTSLSCPAGAVDLNGHVLYVDGKAYDGSASTGSAIEHTVSSGGAGQMGTPPDGKTPPEGAPGGPGSADAGQGGTPPEPPEGVGGQRPEKPGENKSDSTDGNSSSNTNETRS